MEAEEQVRLLNAEDFHLQALKEELDELRRGMQEDLAAASIASGRSTPTNILNTPARSCSEADDIDSLCSESRSPLLQTPSPPHYHNNNNSSRQGFHHPQHRRLQAHALSPTTSGTTTPLTPHSPLSTTQLSADDHDEAWLAFSPSPCSVESVQQQQKPEVAVPPPLPPGLKLPLAFAGLDAALTAAFEEGGLDLDDWENEEEWLVKTARGNNNNTKTNKEKKQSNAVAAVDSITINSTSITTTTTTGAPLIVRPLPRVQVPRLNLNTNSTLPHTPRGGGPLTLSARGGIRSNNNNNDNVINSARRQNSENTARRQQSQLTSRLSNSSAASTSTPRTARSNSYTSPSGSSTARRNRAVAASSASHSPSSICSGGSATRDCVGNESSPSLFSKSIPLGAVARRDAPTPRLVFGQGKSTTAPTPNSKKATCAVEVKGFPLLCSPSSTSIICSTTTDGGETTVDARPTTKIPRLQLPLI
jgi:hypothetical protein